MSVELLVNAKRRTHFTWPVGEVAQLERMLTRTFRLLFTRASSLTEFAHHLYTLKRLNRAHQATAAKALRTTHHIAAVMHAVRNVNVEVTRRSKHGRIALARTAKRMTCGIILVVSLGLHNSCN